MPSAFALSRRTRAFTMVEMMAVIVIMLMLAVAAFETVFYLINSSRTVASQQTLQTLNDALNRYKDMGGDISGLTSGADIGNVLNNLKQPLNWCGLTHNVLNASFTYPSRSLSAQGDGKSYIFTRADTYTVHITDTSSGGSGGPSGPVLAAGEGYLKNGAGSGYWINIQTQTGAYAWEDPNGTVAMLGTGWRSIPAVDHFKVWSCASTSDSTPAGNITAISAANCYITSFDFTKLPGVTNINLDSNFLSSSIDLRTNTFLQVLNVGTNPNLTSINVSGLLYLNNLQAYNCDQLAAIDASGCTGLTDFRIDTFASKLVTINFNGCTNLASFPSGFCNSHVITMLDLRGTAIAGSTSAINAVYTQLPDLSAYTSVTHTIRLGASAASATDTTATAKGWIVQRN